MCIAYVCVHAYVYVYMCAYYCVRVLLCMCVRTYVCMYTCIYEIMGMNAEYELNWFVGSVLVNTELVLG